MSEERTLMALFDTGHRLSLPSGYWLSKDDDNKWQVGHGESYLAFHIATNLPCGKGGSFDSEAQEFAKLMLDPIVEVAAFLDRLAKRIQPWMEWDDGNPILIDEVVADCRAQARRLRGEKDEQSQT